MLFDTSYRVVIECRPTISDGSQNFKNRFQSRRQSRRLRRPSVYQGGPISKLSCCLQKSKLFDWGGQACRFWPPLAPALTGSLLYRTNQCCSRDHMLRDRDQDRDRIIFSRPRPGVFRDPRFETETSKNRDRDQDRDRQLFGLLKQI